MIDGELIDPLTGLPSRDSMMQAVAQADFDRERFAVAVLDVRRFAHFNRRYGMVVGDELLCVIGRALLLHTATGTEACRLGADRFAIIAAEPECSTRWVAPIVTAVRAAVEQWVESRQPQETTERPEIIVGVAEGWTAEVWTNAETALQTAKHNGVPVVDYRTVDRATRLRLRPGPAVDPAADALIEHDPILIQRRIDPVGRPEPAWLWLRVSAEPATASPTETREAAAVPMADRESQLVEQWIMEQACRQLSTADRQMRISVPVSAEAARARSLAQHLFPLIEEYRVPPSRLVFEIDFDTVAADDRGSVRRSIDPVGRFIHEVAGLGSSVAITGFGGGWAAWTRLRQLEVRYLQPAVDLMKAADRGDGMALRSLATITANADDAGMEVIAPWLGRESPGTLSLAELGFDYQESPAAGPTSSRSIRPTAFARTGTG